MPRIDRYRATAQTDGLDYSASNGAMTAPWGSWCTAVDRRRYICDASNLTPYHEHGSFLQGRSKQIYPAGSQNGPRYIAARYGTASHDNIDSLLMMGEAKET